MRFIGMKNLELHPINICRTETKKYKKFICCRLGFVFAILFVVKKFICCQLDQQLLTHNVGFETKKETIQA